MHPIEKLAIPSKPELPAALGRLAIAHTHLELVLRYAVKSITGLSVKEALDATNGERTSDVRERVKKLFRQKEPTALEKCQLDALLGAAKRLSEQRNNFLHSAWSETEAGEALLKDGAYQWGAAPTVEQVDKVTNEILELVNQINNARLQGFVYDVINRHRETELKRSAAA